MSVPVSVHQLAPDSTAGYWLDSAPDLSSTNGTQAYCADAEHQATDLAIWGFESLAARHVIAGQPVCIRSLTLVLVIFGPIWSALVDDQGGRASATDQPPVAIGKFKRHGTGDSDGRPVGGGDASSGGR
jgi:hypothetical protein